MRFPDIRAARTLEDSLYLVVLILWVAHFLAPYRALRGRASHPPSSGASLASWGPRSVAPDDIAILLRMCATLG
jgi:hypothetical protein